MSAAIASINLSNWARVITVWHVPLGEGTPCFGVDLEHNPLIVRTAEFGAVVRGFFSSSSSASRDAARLCAGGVDEGGFACAHALVPINRQTIKTLRILKLPFKLESVLHKGFRGLF